MVLIHLNQELAEYKKKHVMREKQRILHNKCQRQLHADMQGLKTR